MTARALVEDVVYRAALALDDRDYRAFLDLCAADFRYIIGAYSPEIRRQMVWLDHDKAGMQLLFETLPRHNSDHSPLTRHVTVYLVEVQADGATAATVSALQVFRTALDGGTTEIYAVGKILDTIRLGGERAQLVRREIRLDTRMLGIGSHIPF